MKLGTHCLLGCMVLTLVSSCDTQPPVDLKVEFTDFVAGEIDNTSDTRDPVDIDDTEFEFDEDEDAFNDVLDE
jgi:hypothetical protein